MGKKQRTEIPVTVGSGNVFADLGFEAPEEELTKAQLASQIRQIIGTKRLTQVAAAKIMGVDQPKVSALLNGRLENFSSDRLMRFLTLLGQDVEIVIRAKRSARGHGQILVRGDTPPARTKKRSIRELYGVLHKPGRKPIKISDMNPWR
jgi:predicted XRE-type DNA-binding protein